MKYILDISINNLHLMANYKTIYIFIQMAKLQSILSRRFDSGLGGISLSEFIILQELANSKSQMLRRVDLAASVGLTASGITRMLLPMEKIGLVSRKPDPEDARASFVVLAPGGKLKLEEAIERAKYLASEIAGELKSTEINQLSDALNKFTVKPLSK